MPRFIWRVCRSPRYEVKLRVVRTEEARRKEISQNRSGRHSDREEYPAISDPAFSISRHLDENVSYVRRAIENVGQDREKDHEQNDLYRILRFDRKLCFGRRIIRHEARADHDNQYAVVNHTHLFPVANRAR